MRELPYWLLIFLFIGTSCSSQLGTNRFIEPEKIKDRVNHLL